MIYLFLIWFITDAFYLLFRKQGWTAINYKQEVIVQGFGLNLFIHYLLFLGMMFTVYTLGLAPTAAVNITLPATLVLFSMMLFCLTLLGWIDDRWGDQKVKGFRGHFGRLIRDRHVTTGLAKAVFGLVVALMVSWQLSSSWAEFILFSMAMALSMHIFNLLDVRPGRALKSYWVFSAAVVPFLSIGTALFLVIPVFFSTLMLFRYDRRQLAMLGDTGSMALGGTFGFQLIAHAPLFMVAVLVFFFLGLTIAAERISLTTWIEQHGWLAKWDRWGLVDKS
ncbi:hypothetical protein J2S00_000481 [Caldalkalibacillus uzonensis]|uniref:Uncharacterized protein n=1 Tax=Caldalkalibacillus uzonensis TaxID=353224 RepID=A0ABU0CP92_9BACI|nr:hypothetical protein [Caldalkalibacillus uzonensis]MDQ0337711.1 hypothetical protein [Caldalkalibacillus uzonensis]